MKITTYACIPISFDFLPDQSGQQNKQSIPGDFLIKKIIDWCNTQPFSNKLAEDFFKGFELIGFNKEQISLLNSDFKPVTTISPQSSQSKCFLADTINHAEDISQYFASLTSNFSVEVQDAVLTTTKGKSEDTIVFYADGYRCDVKFDFAGAFCKSEGLPADIAAH